MWATDGHLRERRGWCWPGPQTPARPLLGISVETQGEVPASMGGHAAEAKRGGGKSSEREQNLSKERGDRTDPHKEVWGTEWGRHRSTLCSDHRLPVHGHPTAGALPRGADRLHGALPVPSTLPHINLGALHHKSERKVGKSDQPFLTGCGQEGMHLSGWATFQTWAHSKGLLSATDHYHHQPHLPERRPTWRTESLRHAHSGAPVSARNTVTQRGTLPCSCGSWGRAMGPPLKTAASRQSTCPCTPATSSRFLSPTCVKNNSLSSGSDCQQLPEQSRNCYGFLNLALGG